MVQILDIYVGNLVKTNVQVRRKIVLVDKIGQKGIDFVFRVVENVMNAELRVRLFGASVRIL